MGTNFYATIPVKKRDKERAVELIEEERYKEASELLSEFLKEVHIGKRSAGWKFLFNANNLKYYEPTKEGLNKFFLDNNVIIKDEYGTVFSIDDFWKEIDKSLEKGYDIETYYKDHPNEVSSYYEKIPKMYEKYNPSKYGEFYNDGLRFATFDEFC